jgi:hypothetical protein
MDAIEEMKDNNMVVLPDFDSPSLTISDLYTCSRNAQEEFRCTIQFMHPLMSLIMAEARGRYFRGL